MSPSITDPEMGLSAFSNLEEMRDRHLQLLEVCDPDSGTPPVSLESELWQFIQEGSALGRQLSSPKERQEAQALLNFWTSSLSSGRSPNRPSRSNIESTRDKALSTFGSSGVVALMPFDEKVAGELAEKALTRIKPKTPAEELELTRLLAGLIRLDNSTGDVRLTQLPGDDSALIEDGTPTPAARQLKNEGLLSESVRANGKVVVSISNESLTQRWPFLQSICQNRKALAQAAKAWDKTGRHRAALQPGSPLVREARAYRDLSPTEQDFIEESRGSDRDRLLIGGGIALTVLLVAVLYLVYSQLVLSDVNEKLRKAVDRERSAVEQEKEATKKAEEAKKEAEEAEKKAEGAADTEKALRIDLQQRLAEAQRNAKLTNESQAQAEQYKAQLEELKTSLSKSAVVPTQAKKVLNEYTQHSIRTEGAFSGVQAEVFVSGEKSEFVSKAQKFVKALLDHGIEFPVPKPQTRIHVPDPISEVRYYYKGDDYSDELLAKQVMQLLINAGVPHNKIMIAFVDDKTAPKKFIQVSLANSAFK